MNGCRSASSICLWRTGLLRRCRGSPLPHVAELTANRANVPTLGAIAPSSDNAGNNMIPVEVLVRLLCRIHIWRYPKASPRIHGLTVTSVKLHMLLRRQSGQGAPADWPAWLEPARAVPRSFFPIRPEVLKLRLRWCASPHSSKQLKGKRVTCGALLPPR